MEPTQTALVVAVPETEAAVGPFRASLDRAASWGVPAHVTLLYPFLPPARIDEAVLATLRRIVAAQPCSEVVFDRVEWFGDTVLWLAPRPDRLFRDLTAALWREFPETPPYGGAFADVVPHLTVGHDAPPAVLHNAAEVVATALPIRARVDSVRLIAGSPAPHTWQTHTTFPLTPRRSEPPGRS